MLISAPWAKDATGLDVPLNLSVSDNVVDIAVDHRAASYTYPILLDPAYQAMSVGPNEEKRWCASHPRDCYKLNKLKNKAVKSTKYHYLSKTWQDGEGDAFRHCYLSAMTTVTFGAQKSEEIGDRHERSFPGPQLAEDMDQRNNRRGRIIGVNYPEWTEGGCLWLEQNNRLWVLNASKTKLVGSGYKKPPVLSPR